jgi:hypothetical protein
MKYQQSCAADPYMYLYFQFLGRVSLLAKHEDKKCNGNGRQTKQHQIPNSKIIILSAA